MPRIDKPTSPQPETQPPSQKKKVAKPKEARVVRPPKRYGFAMGCVTTFVVLVIASLVFLLYVVARAGLVNVPGLSGLVYEEPRPTAVVEPGETLEASLQEQVTVLLEERITIEGIEDRAAELQFADTAITASMRVAATEASDNKIRVSGMQAMVLPEGVLEVYLPLTVNNGRSAVIALLRPSIDEEGILVLEVDRLQVGQWRVPQFLAELMLNQALRVSSESFNKDVGRYVTLTDIQFEPNFMILAGELNVEAIPFVLDPVPVEPDL